MRKNPKKPAKVLMIRGVAHAGSSLLITQEDLEEERLLRRELVEASRALRRKRLEIRGALDAGAAIEQGCRTAEILDSRRLVIR